MTGITPPSISAELINSMDAQPASVTFLRFSQNAVYTFLDRHGTARILRLTLNSHRTREEIEDELAWICELRGAGLSVCLPVPQAGGELIRSFAGPPELFHAVVFEKGAGRAVTKSDLSPRLSYLHGRQLGKLHAFSRRSPDSHLKCRTGWAKERYFTRDIADYLPVKVRSAVQNVWRELSSVLTLLPADPDTYGPVHLDLGYSNLLLNGERLELIDFDNCARGYYACDAALALYGSLFTSLRCEFSGDRSAFAHPGSSRNLEQIWQPFREGYLTENHWPEEWNRQMPLWFEAAYFRSVVHAFRMQAGVEEPRVQALLAADVENVLARRPPICFDFESGRAHSRFNRK